MATLKDEIRDLKVEIAGYRQDYATANTLEEKKMNADLITTRGNYLTALLQQQLQQQQQQQQAQAGGGQAQGGGGGQAQGKDVVVDVMINETNISVRCTLFKDEERGLLGQIVSCLKEMEIGRRNTEWSAFKLYDSSGNVVGNWETIIANEPLVFKVPTVLWAESASDWTSEKIRLLRIQFEDNTPLGLDTSLSPVAEALTLRLKPLNSDAVRGYVSLLKTQQPTDAMLTQMDDPLIKAVFMVSKYTEVESTVDLFVVLLLYELGFYTGRLFAFPQFSMDLFFGEKRKFAIPDITLMDVFSFLRMVVLEDKKASSENKVNAEPQLIAEMIAMHQNNFSVGNPSKKRVRLEDQKESEENLKESISKPESLRDLLESEDSLVGIRVTGTKFAIYVMRESEHVLNAMKYQQQAANETVIHRFGPFDFVDPNHRRSLISFLDYFRNIASQRGAASERRNSFSSKGRK